MTPAERLVNHIREFIHGFDQEATPEAHEMSMQFSDLCHSLNERLARCADFLRKGRRSEAVQAALTQPSVFELAETLDFDDVKKWQNLCLDLEMIPAAEINLETIENLRGECSKEQLLEPLLREFRRLVHTGSRDERIHILRRIRSHDEDNPVWRENLEPLEQEQLVELQRKAGQSMAAGNLDDVLDIYTDMTAQHRVVEVPADAVFQIESWLHKRREMAAQEEGERLVEVLHESLEQRNFSGLQPLLQAWDRLIRYPDFKPSASMADIAAKAGAWYKDEEQGRARKKDFKEDLRQLQGLLKNPDLAGKNLEAQWGVLQAYGEELPEGLEASVNETRNRLRKAVSRRRRNRSLTTLFILALLIGGGAAGAFYGMRYYRISEAKREMSALWTAERYQDLRRHLNQLSQTPWLYDGAKAEFYTSKTDEKIAAEEARVQGFGKVIASLMQVKSQGYSAGGETITSLLTEARTYAVEEDEKNRLDSWERNWKSWRVDHQAQVDASGKTKVDGLERALKRARDNDQAPLARRFNELAKLQQQAEKAGDEIRNASASIKEQLNRVTHDVTSWGKELEQEKDKEAASARRYAEALAAIPRTAGNIDSWQLTLDDFIKEFGAAKETPDLRRAFAQHSAARDAVALAGFTIKKWPGNAAEAKIIEDLVKGLPGGADSVWRKDLLSLKDQNAGYAKMRAELDRLHMVDFYDIRQVKVRKKGTEGWQTLFIPEYFHSKDVEGKPGVKQYWGKVYGLKPDAAKAVPEHFSVTTDEFDVVLPEKEEDALVPAARYVRTILGQLPNEMLFPHLLGLVDELKDRTDIRPIPKAMILQILGKAIYQGIPMRDIGFEKYGRAFDGLNIDVPWFNQTAPAVLEAEKEVLKRIADLPESKDLTQIQEFNRQLVMASLNRKIQCVGVVWRNEETGRLQPFLSRGGIKTLWILQPAEHGLPNRLSELAVADQNGAFSLPEAGSGRVVTGQLLFAPADDKSCADILQALPAIKDRKDIRWPTSWPVNRCQMPSR